MRVVVIGGTGHVGSYLIPRLVNDGHAVISVSRNRQKAYFSDDAWAHVESVDLDREALDQQNEFGKKIAELDADVVIDLICFNLDSARQLFETVSGSVKQFLHCGTVWVYGANNGTPNEEHHDRTPLGEYGRNKAQIEAYLLAASTARTAVTVIHPGHIVGPGWIPLNPAGNFNPSIFTQLSMGKEIVLPDQGLQTLHHVHADDVAQAFQKAMKNVDAAAGESFNVVSDKALSLTDYANEMAKAQSREAVISYLPMQQWREQASVEDYEATLVHLAHSTNCSHRKASEKIGFSPRYSTIEAVLESLKVFRQKYAMR